MRAFPQGAHVGIAVRYSSAMNARQVYASIVVVSLGLLVAAVWTTPTGPEAHSLGYDESFHHDDPTSEPPPVRFRDATLEFGIGAVHHQGDERLAGIDETLGSGACVLDYNNDGWMDLFIVNGAGHTRYYGKAYWWQQPIGHALYENRDGRRFADVTGAAGLADSANAMGCAAADFDNDGNVDLLVTGFDYLKLWRNQGDGSFRDETAASGLAADGWHTAIAVADVDGDARLDLYLGRFIDFNKGARTYESARQFKADNSPLFEPTLYPALANRLYRNEGGGRFIDVTATAGVANADGRTLGAMWIDLDGDDKLDLLVTNAPGVGSNKAYLNKGNWRFEDIGAQARMESSLGFRGQAAADIDGDGDLEVFMAGGGAYGQLLVRHGEKPLVYRDEARSRGVASEVDAALMQWSPLFGDWNGDGHPDLFVANGMITPDSDVSRVSLGQPKSVWLNGGGGKFRPARYASSSPLNDIQSARGAVRADFNNDGRPDIYVVHNNDLGQLLLNESPEVGHWIGIDLVGSHGGRDSIGAKVCVTTSVGRQCQWQIRNAGFLSDSDPRLLFGLGPAQVVTTIEVRWPDGSESRHGGVPVDRYTRIAQGGSLEPGVAAIAGEDTSMALQVGVEDPGQRVDYLRLLALGASESRYVSQLIRAKTDPDPAVRMALVSVLEQSRSLPAMAALAELLSDDDGEIAAAAARVLCGYEEEYLVRWLLRGFHHPAPQLRRALAECFAFYFREEEAVIHRKYLALAALAEAADTDVEPVRLAAIAALGDAEQYRSTLSLIELLKSPVASVQAQAARALGLIRERRAVEPLLELLATDGFSADVYAHALIALKRLDFAGLPQRISAFAAGSDGFAGYAFELRVQTLSYLLESGDGLVFDRRSLLELLINASQGVRNAFGPALFSRLSPATIAAYIDAVGRTGVPEAAAIVRPFVEHSSAQVRLAAFRRLFLLEPAQRNVLIGQAQSDADPSVRAGVWQQARDHSVDIAPQIHLAALDDPATRLAAVAAAGPNISQEVADAIAGLTHKEAASDDVRAAALAALARSRRAAGVPIAAIAADDPVAVRAARLYYEASRLPNIVAAREPPPFLAAALADRDRSIADAALEILFDRNEAWAKRAILELIDAHDNDGLRRRAIEAAEAALLERSDVLQRVSQRRDDPVRDAALRRLIEIRKSPEFLWSVLTNSGEAPRLRMAAALALGRYDVKLLPRIIEVLTRTSHH